jgi:hypothetical protein
MTAILEFRTRQKTKMHTISFGETVSYYFDSLTHPDPVITVSLGTSQTFTLGKTMVDLLTPDYGLKAKEGNLPINQMYMEDVEVDTFVVSHIGYTRKTEYEYYNHVTRVYEPHIREEKEDRTAIIAPLYEHHVNNLDTDQLLETVQVELRAELARTHALILVTIAELKKTAGLIGDGVKSFQAAIAVLETDLAKVRSSRRKFLWFIDSLQSGWLRVRYGVRPLVHDVSNLMTAMTKLLQPDVWGRKTRTGVITQEHISNPVSVTYFIGQTAHGTLTYREILRYTAKARAGAHWRINPGVSNDINRRLGTTRVLSSAWELVPFSFVVDWFANVSNVIASLELSPSIEMKNRFISLRKTKERFILVEGWSPKRPDEDTSAFASLVGNEVLFSREVLYSREPSAGFVVFTNPTINVNLNPFKVADLWFLARSFLQRFTRP